MVGVTPKTAGGSGINEDQVRNDTKNPINAKSEQHDNDCARISGNKRQLNDNDSANSGLLEIEERLNKKNRSKK